MSFTSVLIALVACFGSVLPAIAQNPLEIKVGQEAQRIDGFGGSSAWYEDEFAKFPAEKRAEMLDWLFDAEKGAGFSILRIRIEPKWIDAEKRYDWENPQAQLFLSFVREAAPRVPVLMASPWSPPAWMKDNGMTEKGGSLLPENYDAYAAYLLTWVRDLEKLTSAKVNVLSVQNEPGKKPWEATEWTKDAFVTFFGRHMVPAWEASGLPLRLMANEETGWNDAWINALLSDPASAKGLGVAAAHAYHGGWKRMRPFKEVAAHALPLWMTEHYSEEKDKTDIEQALINARICHDTLVKGGANAYLFWWLFADVNKGLKQSLINLDFKEESYLVTKKLHALAHFSRFVRPGMVRLETEPANPADGISVSAFRDKLSGKTVIVAINETILDTSIIPDVAYETDAEILAWRTSASEDVAPTTAFESAGGTLLLDLPAQSVTTVVFPGQSQP